jgi:hypothetical protein
MHDESEATSHEYTTTRVGTQHNNLQLVEQLMADGRNLQNRRPWRGRHV